MECSCQKKKKKVQTRHLFEFFFSNLSSPFILRVSQIWPIIEQIWDMELTVSLGMEPTTFFLWHRSAAVSVFHRFDVESASGIEQNLLLALQKPVACPR